MHKNSNETSDLVENYGRLVSSLCRRMIYDEEDAQDTAQEIWLEVMKSLPSFRGDSKFSTWIYTIACRIILRRARKERVYSERVLKGYFHREEMELPAVGDFDKDFWVKESCHRCLTGILHCLDTDARMAYILRDVAQLPYREIAEILARDTTTTRQIVTRARRKLKNFLEGQCVFYNPQGQCTCRMRRWVVEVDLPREYEALGKSIARTNVFRGVEEMLPVTNDWKQYLEDCL